VIIAKFIRLLIIAAVLFLSGAPDLSYAASEAYRQKLKEETAPKEEGLPNEINHYTRYMPSRNISAAAGKVAVIDTGTQYRYNLKAFGKLPVVFSVAAQYIGIDETAEVPLPAHLTVASLGMETTLPVPPLEHTYLRLGLSPSFYSDDWNFNSSTFRLPARSFFIYQPQPQLTFILGVAVSPGTENKVSPVAGVIYQPNDKLLFKLIPERPNISYALDSKLSVFIEGDMARQEFKVNYPGAKHAALRYEEMRAGSGVKYRFNKFVQASLGAGRVFRRTLKYRDSLGKVGIKDGFYSEFRMELDF